MAKTKEDLRPLGSPQSWAKTPGTYISAQAHIAGADEATIQMELKWGVGRLRLLVSPELRERFDRQRYLYNQAIWHGDLENVRTQSARMIAAWRALNGAAEAAGADVLSADVWEVRLDDGTVAAIVPDLGAACGVMATGRGVAVYTLDEIGRILSHHSAVNEAKHVFPGATVEEVRRHSDPLHAIVDTKAGLDDPFDDDPPTFGA